MSEIYTKMLGTYTRAFLAIFTTAAVGAYLDSGKDIFSVSLTDWKTYLAAGLGAGIPVLLRWLNPKDEAYGLVIVRDEDGNLI